MLCDVVCHAADVHVCTFEGAANFHLNRCAKKPSFSDTSTEFVAEFEFLRYDSSPLGNVVTGVAHSLRPPADRCAQPALLLVINGHGRDELQHSHRCDVAVLEQRDAELAVLLTARCNLGEEQVE